MAVSVGILVEIILMIFFCAIELVERLLLDCQRLLIVLLLVGIDGFDYWQILGIGVIDSGAISQSESRPIMEYVLSIGRQK